MSAPLNRTNHQTIVETIDRWSSDNNSDEPRMLHYCNDYHDELQHWIAFLYWRLFPNPRCQKQIDDLHENRFILLTILHQTLRELYSDVCASSYGEYTYMEKNNVSFNNNTVFLDTTYDQIIKLFN